MRTLLLIFLGLSSLLFAEERPPNIVYIMSDELAYFELGHMGNPYIKTPNMDKMAEQGIRFTNAYAASPVCAPLRGQLMTGKHSGHASVRANDGGTPLRADEVTIASMLKDQKGYATGGYGKWGAGGRDSTGVPEKHGFDDFFGYYDQVHAHSFYPPYLVRNSEEVELKGNIGGRTGESYAHYPIMKAGLEFIRKNKDKPFFAYFPITPPHGMYDIPADDPAWEQYKDEEWMKDPSLAQDIKNYAAMVTMIDNDLGDIVALLEELKLTDNTVVFFTGDNGGEDRFKSKDHPRGFFGANVNPKTGVGFRGGKRLLYEGGLKIPFLVKWPGKIKAGRVSDFMFAQYDIMDTLADIAGAKAPDDTDGISILPELLGKKQEGHEMFYWEYGSQTAVRWEQWKAIQPKKDGPWELYDLNKDISEANDVAARYPAQLKKMQEFAKSQHIPAVIGTYSDPERKRHEKDRWAKWGTVKDQPTSLPKGTSKRIKHKHRIPADQVKLLRFSSENRGNDRLAPYAINGMPGKVWHSNFSDKPAKHPHELVVDLGRARELTSIHYLARQDKGWNGAFAKTSFFISNNPDQFPEKPQLTATFTKTKEPQPADFDQPLKGRYVLIRNESEVNGGKFGSAADIGFIEVGPNEKPENLAFVDKWHNAADSWAIAGEVVGSKEKKEWAKVEDGKGIFYNGSKEKAANIRSKFQHGDVEAQVEFMVPKGSNSGLYFMERYEVQILDSFGKSNAQISKHDCGAIYERWNKDAPKGKQGYEGNPPSSNQSKAPGKWQSFHIVFRAPRFDANGNKTEKARFVSVKHNGVEIHRNVEVTGPTRGGKGLPEAPVGSLVIQGDHGPVAFRKIHLKPLTLP